MGRSSHTVAAHLTCAMQFDDDLCQETFYYYSIYLYSTMNVHCLYREQDILASLCLHTSMEMGSGGREEDQLPLKCALW